jgi:heme-degrading monooxygenase HmoA
MTVIRLTPAQETLASSQQPYVMRTELLVAAGHAADFEQRQARTSEEAMGFDGFHAGSLLRSYSHPAKYVVLSRFDTVESAWSFERSDLSAARAAGTTVVAQEGYELAFEHAVGSHLPVACELLVDEVVERSELVLAYEAARRQLFELRGTYSRGYSYGRLLRSGGRLGRYLIVEGYTDVRVAGAANTPADVQAFIHDHPVGLYTDREVSWEAYAAIARVQRETANRSLSATKEAT